MQTAIPNKQTNQKLEWTQMVIFCAYASAFFAAIGLIFLVIFFSGYSLFGPLNDIAVIIHYILLLPIMVYIYKILRPEGERLHELTLAIGVIGAFGVVILQALLVLGVMPFTQQILLVIPAFLVGTVWFILTERLGKHDERLPKGQVLHVLAGLVFAYPVWALILASRLKSSLKARSTWTAAE